MEGERGPDRVDAVVERIVNESRLPPQLAAELADDLPETPGVYLFRGEGGALLYVGKSRNLRSRVFDHFAAEHRSGKESQLARQVRDVEWIETGGELGALLLESKLVKQLAPTANRRLRRSDALSVVRLQQRDGALRPRGRTDRCGIVRSREHSLRPVPIRAGCVAGASRARRAKPSLCLKVLGREAGEGSCFAHQLGRCRGACVGKEPLALHDARLQLALASLKLKPWPFAGAVGIREPGPGGQAPVLHVIDRWQHLGTARDAGEIEALVRAAVAGSIRRRQLSDHRTRASSASHRRQLVMLDGRD